VVRDHDALAPVPRGEQRVLLGQQSFDQHREPGRVLPYPPEIVPPDRGVEVQLLGPAVDRELERVPPIAVALPQQRRVHGPHDRREPRLGGPPKDVAREAAIAIHVQLEPLVRVGGSGDILEFVSGSSRVVVEALP
jgi:hypothetical protein